MHSTPPPVMQAAPTFTACLSENHFAHLKYDEAIDRRLREQFLFHPKGIAIPDSFVFTDTVRNNLARAEPWLLSAMELGLVTIMCRFDGLATFGELQERLKPMGFGTAERPEMRQVANRLDGFSKHVSWKPWPANMGLSYKKLVWGSLHASPDELAERAGDNSAARRFLDALPKFQLVLDDAAMAAENHGRPGDLRHSEIIRALSQRYFNRADLTATHRLIELGLDKNNDGIAADDVRAFLAIIARLYDRNFGRAAYVSVETIEYDRWIESFCDPAPVEAARNVDDDPGLFLTVRLPPQKVLTRLAPDKLQTLLEVRKDYEAAYSAFLTPDNDFKRMWRREGLRDALKDYCEKIYEAAGRPPMPREYVVRIGRRIREAIRLDGTTVIARSLVRSLPTAAQAVIQQAINPLMFLKPFFDYGSDVVEFYVSNQGSTIKYSVSGQVDIRPE